MVRAVAKLHVILSYNFQILSKFPAHDHIKINGEVEQNYSDNFVVDFVVKKNVFKHLFILREIHNQKHKIYVKSFSYAVRCNC